jgi:GntR family phosphonate transport system transcriptional regulator
LPSLDEIERGLGVALWRQIEEQLGADIEAGTIGGAAIGADGRLPTENALAARFGVNRHTVRRALGALVQRGLVRVEQGRGAFVQGEIIDYALGLRTRFSQNIARHHREPGGKLVRALELAASEAAARALDIPPGTALVGLDSLREADGLPISVGRHLFPADRFRGIAEAYQRLGSLTRALALFGVADYTRKLTRLTARLPSAEEARQLRQPPTVPILQSEAVNIDAAGLPIEYGVAAFAGGRVQFVIEE